MKSETIHFVSDQFKVEPGKEEETNPGIFGKQLAYWLKDRFQKKGYSEQEIVHRTNRLRTDVIVCAGDYVHESNTIEEIKKVWPVLSKLEAKHGVYSVLGNHDHWADFDRSLYWLERTGQNIRHECKPIYKGRDRILIGGAGDYWEDELKIDNAFFCSDENDCRILLSHNPDSVDTEFNTPLSLVLSGHTSPFNVIFIS